MHINGNKSTEVINSTEDDGFLLAPYNSFISKDDDEKRNKILYACNKWLGVDDKILKQIMEIINMIFNGYSMIDKIDDESEINKEKMMTLMPHGMPQTINSANFVYFLALEKILKLENQEAVKIYTEYMRELLRGQGKEIFWSETQTCPTEEEYEEMTIQKTGSVVGLAFKLMLLFSNVNIDPEKLIKLASLSLQLWNDYFTFISDEKNIKQNAFDEILADGRYSYPIIYALSQRTDGKDDIIQNILRRRNKNKEAKKYFITVLKERGSFEHTLQRLKQLNNELREEIKSTGGIKYINEIMSAFEQSYPHLIELEPELKSQIQMIKNI